MLERTRSEGGNRSANEMQDCDNLCHQQQQQSVKTDNQRKKQETKKQKWKKEKRKRRRRRTATSIPGIGVLQNHR